MKDTKEKMSYCIGFETAKNLLTQFADLDVPLLMTGVQDAIQYVREGSPAKISNQEMTALLNNLRQQVELQQKEYIGKLAEKNKKEGESFLNFNKQKDGVHCLPSGLQYKILSTSQGKNPTLFDQVSVHYTGSLIDGTVFDSSHSRGQPTVFPVNRVIPGWSEALQLMKEGEKWQIFIPHYLAYGEHGFGREIGPNTTLVFEMELIAINPN